MEVLRPNFPSRGADLALPAMQLERLKAMAVEHWPIERLSPYANNPRKHSQEQTEQIARSIIEWGWTMPILCDEDGEVIAGHGRLLAALMLNLTQVPVIVARGWSPAQKRAYVIADNRLTEASEWDDEKLHVELSDLLDEGFALSLTGMSADELAALSVGVQALEEMPELSDGERAPYREMTFVLAEADAIAVEQAVAHATARIEGDQKNRSGRAIGSICREYLEGHQ